MEYTISYGTNGLDYADYKEPGGNSMVRTDTKSVLLGLWVSRVLLAPCSSL
jgi:hypothetical protein